tara:strand:- start:3840 stop:4442 length:603 start_codon:yes stop_codon:yes gene_type:complete
VIILYDEQGSEAWLKSRLGRPSASCFSKLITTTGKASTQADGYINQLIGEKLTGELTPMFKSDAMERGNELEPQAKFEYECLYGVTVDETGFILNDSSDYGCSPDGLILGESKGLEIKCPLTQTMVKYKRNPKELVKAYYQQIQGCMWVTGYQSWDAFAYHPDTDHVCVNVERDEDFIEKLAIQVDLAVTTIKKETEKFK